MKVAYKQKPKEEKTRKEIRNENLLDSVLNNAEFLTKLNKICVDYNSGKFKERAASNRIKKLVNTSTKLTFVEFIPKKGLDENGDGMGFTYTHRYFKQKQYMRFASDGKMLFLRNSAD